MKLLIGCFPFLFATQTLATLERPSVSSETINIAVSITALQDTKFNTEAPFSLDIMPCSLTLPKTHFTLSDAKVTGPNSIVFEMPVKASSLGIHELKAKLKFYLCGSGWCRKIEHDIKETFTVETGQASIALPAYAFQ